MYNDYPELFQALRTTQIQLANAIIDIARIVLALTAVSALACGIGAYSLIDHLPLFLVFLALMLCCIALTFWAWVALPAELDELF